MISMSAWGCGGNPVLGAIVSSLHTLSEPQPMRSGSWYSANEKWCLASSQPWFAPPRLSKGLRSIILLLRFIEARFISAISPRSHVSGPLKEETIETHRFQYVSSGSRSLGDLRQSRSKRLLFACGGRARPRQSDGFEGDYPTGTADRRRPPPPHLTQGGVERGRPQPARSRVPGVERGRGRRSLCLRAIRGAARHGAARRADVIWSRPCGADPARVPDRVSGSDDRSPSG